MPMSDSRHLHWGAESLWQELDAVLPGLSVEIVASADSTNTRLLERAQRSSGRRSGPVTTPGQLDSLPQPANESTPYGRRQDDTRPCLLVAEQQHGGRGRQGRVWHSTAGLSLTFSLALAMRPPSWSGLSLAVGVALADAIDPPAGDAPPRVGLKWPNDLWLMDSAGRGRKLGGVLIETRPAAAGTLADAPTGSSGGSAKAPADSPFRYTKEIRQGQHAMLEFETEIDGTYVNGVDIITCDAAGMITEFTVMMRPLQAINLVHARMKAMLERLSAP